MGCFWNKVLTCSPCMGLLVYCRHAMALQPCAVTSASQHVPCVWHGALALQGMSDGSIQLWPLIAYAVPHLGARSPRAELKGHSGMVVCLQEVPAPHQVPVRCFVHSAWLC